MLRLTEEQFSAHQKRVAKPAAKSRHGNPSKPVSVGKGIGDPNSRLLADQIAAAGLQAPILEYRFAPPRKWRADLAYPERHLLIEIDGAVHRIKGRFQADLERDQAIFFGNWEKLRVSPAQVRSGEALKLVRRALA